MYDLLHLKTAILDVLYLQIKYLLITGLCSLSSSGIITVDVN